MKKVLQFDSHRTINQKKDERVYANSPSRKQIELIYRQKRSTEACQPFVLPASKKCELKSTLSKRKINPKDKKQQIEELKKLVSELQRQLKLKKYQEKSKELQVVKSVALKPTTKQMSSTQCVDTVSGKTKSRWNKYRKQNNLSTENVKKYKNALSPSRNIREKPDQTQISKFLRSTQSTFRKQALTKPSKKGKKERINLECPLNLQDSQEYVLLENNFVELCAEQASFLTEKLLSSRNFIERRESLNQQKINSDCLNINSPINQEGESVQGEPYNFIGDCSSLTIQNNLNVKQTKNIQPENSSDILETQFITKVILIQRWWRRMIQKNIQRQSQSIITHKLTDESPQDERQMIKSQEMFESALIVHDGFETSPIRLTESNIQWRDDQFDQSLEQRAQAAKLQMMTHKQILEKLFTSKKIAQKDYDEKTVIIQSQYSNELKEIEEIKKLLKMNIQKAENITLKTNEDLIISRNITKEVDDEMLDRIFGENSSNEEKHQQNKLVERPVAKIDVVTISREKSTGCHYDPQEKGTQSIYSQTSPQEQDYKQDFEEEEEDEEDYPLPCTDDQIYTENTQNFQLMNSNYQQMMEQLRLREQAKMQIDRRAAIQMGVLSQQIPEQIRSQYVGIDTSLNNVHRFLLSFFKFYIFYYKDDFLRLINMPYGYNINNRISSLHGYKPDGCFDEDQEGVIYGLTSVIPDEVIDQFYQKIYGMGSLSMTEAQRANFQFDRIHSKALFDSFNEALNYFRPYFQINGQPYPWNNSEKALTFYFIAEENIQEVFEKSQFKVLKWASSLCGILVNKLSKPYSIHDNLTVEEALQCYRNSSHPLLAQTRQDRLTKDQKTQVTQSNYKWMIAQEQKTEVCLQTSEYVFDLMIEELLQQFYLGKQLQNRISPQATSENQMRRSLNEGLQLFQTFSESSSREQIQIY